MIWGGGADLGHIANSARGDVLEHIRAVVEAKDLSRPLADEAAQGWSDAGSHRSPSLSGQTMQGWAEHVISCRAPGDELLGSVDQVDMPIVGLFRGISTGNEAVVHQDHALGGGIRLNRQRNFLGQSKSRPPIPHDCYIVPVRFA